MRLIRGIPVPRINPRARINHANRSDSLGRLQATVTRGAMLTPVTSASPAPGCWAGRAINSLLVMIPNGIGAPITDREDVCGRSGHLHEPPLPEVPT